MKTLLRIIGVVFLVIAFVWPAILTCSYSYSDFTFYLIQWYTDSFNGGLSMKLSALAVVSFFASEKV